MSGTNETARNEAALWAELYRRLLSWAMKHHRLPEEDAKETVQEAMLQFSSRGGRPDAARMREVLLDLGSVVNGIEVNRRRNKMKRATKLTPDGQPPCGPEPDVMTLRAEEESRARVEDKVYAVLEAAQDDKIAYAVVEKFLEGSVTAAEQAKAIGCTVGDIYNARRRLKARVDAVNEQSKSRSESDGI